MTHVKLSVLKTQPTVAHRYPQVSDWKVVELEVKKLSDTDMLMVVNSQYDHLTLVEVNLDIYSQSKGEEIVGVVAPGVPRYTYCWARVAAHLRVKERCNPSTRTRDFARVKPLTS
jgi:hypothetical protein